MKYRHGYFLYGVAFAFVVFLAGDALYAVTHQGVHCDKGQRVVVVGSGLDPHGGVVVAVMCEEVKR